MHYAFFPLNIIIAVSDKLKIINKLNKINTKLLDKIQ